MSTAPVRIDPGSVIGPYVVERRLAQGGMSILFLAHDHQVGRDVVLKVIPDELATNAARARLMREARALASLDHPGIVRVYGTGEYEGTPWIAMEYVRGTDLKRIIGDRGPVSPVKALRWTAQAADALAAAHDAGVIHRDLKPSNLLLTPDDRIKIVDFGIAKRRAETQQGDVLTSQREVLGTPAYLSPEQLEHGLADERSDVWALGCVLYELCVGAPPFGRGGSASTTAAILRDEPVFPENVTGAVMHIINACLRKNSFARIGSARELVILTRDALENPASDLATDKDVRPTAFTSRAPSVAPKQRTEAPPALSSHASSHAPSTHRPSSTSRIAIPVRGSTPPPRHGSSANIPIAKQPTSSSSRVPYRGRIKGTALRAGLLWYAQAFGDGALSRVYGAGSGEMQTMLRASDSAFGVIASGWYDTQLVGELLDAMERIAEPEDPDTYVTSLSAAIAKDNVEGIYRSLFKLVAKPEGLVANGQRVWSTYCDEGTFAARAPEPGQLTFEIRGWQRHHATVCRTIGLLLQNVLRGVGYTALILDRTECAAEGSGYCAFEGLYLV